MRASKTILLFSSIFLLCACNRDPVTPSPTPTPSPEEVKYIKSLNIKSVENTPYLYEATYSDCDYEAGNNFLNNYMPNYESGYYVGGNCSSIRSGKFYGRNFDWTHGTIPEIIVKTKATAERHATLGVSFCYGLSNSEVGKSNASRHKAVPFMTVDGINDQGLCVSFNEIDKKDFGGTNSGSNPGKTKMNVMMLVRYLLDYADSVEHAETLLNNFDVYTPRSLNEQHIMIADKNNNTAVIEFVPNGSTVSGKTKKDIVFYKDNAASQQYFKNISTNFSFIGYTGDCSSWHGSTSSLQLHAQGTERYNLLYEKLYGASKVTLEDLDDVLGLMSEVNYSKVYTNALVEESDSFWFSDYIYYKGDKTTNRTAAEYGQLRSDFLAKKEAHARYNGNNFCESVHSVAYDMNTLEMKIVFEEEHHIDKVFSI